MTRIKILPVYPEFPLTFWGFKSAVEYAGKRAMMPPAGLATVLAMIPEKEFEILRIIDLNVEPLTDEQIKSADLVFTSTMVVQEESHNEVIKRVHSIGKKIVAGGPFPTLYPEKCKEADFIVAGEAEITLRPFLRDFLRGKARKAYTEESIGSKKKPELTLTPIPRWDLVSVGEYQMFPVQNSRGCPFNCEFCNITALNGRFPRTKTPKQMIDEIDLIFKLGHRGDIFIVDDNFIGNIASVKKMLPILIDWQKKHRYPFRFITEASMNLGWPENKGLLEKMAEAGFSTVFLGIESTDPEVLKGMHKLQNIKMSALDSVRAIQKAGIEVTGGFIVGSDADKESVFEDLFNFVQEAGVVIAMPALLSAFQGTLLYERLKQEGRLLKDSGGDNVHHLGFNFKTKLPEEFLIKGYVDMISKLYSPKNYYWRCKVLQKYLGRSKLPMKYVGRSEISALLRSAIKQPFARGGIDYIRFLVRTAVLYPDKFHNAVTSAIQFDHFKKLTKASLDAFNYPEKTQGMYSRFKKAVAETYAKYLPEKNFKAKFKVSKFANKVVYHAEKKYSKLHKDFRKEAISALEEFKIKVDEDLDRLKREIRSTNSG